MTGPPEGKTSPNTCNCCLAANPGRACATITRDPTSSSMPGKHNPTLGPGMSSQKNAAPRESSSSELWGRGFPGRAGWGGARERPRQRPRAGGVGARCGSQPRQQESNACPNQSSLRRQTESIQSLNCAATAVREDTCAQTDMLGVIISLKSHMYSSKLFSDIRHVKSS